MSRENEKSLSIGPRLTHLAERNDVSLSSVAKVAGRCEELNLRFNNAEIVKLAYLSQPDNLGSFLNDWRYDYKTCFGPKSVMANGYPNDCFDAACLAYTVNYLKGIKSYIVLQENSGGQDQNRNIYRNPHTLRWGYYSCDGYSKAKYNNWKSILYGLTKEDEDAIGFSEPIDLIAKFGTDWMDKKEIWDLYYLYIDENINFYSVNRKNKKTHPYNSIHILKKGYIEIESGKPFISLDNLPKKVLSIINKNKDVSIKPDIKHSTPTFRAYYVKVPDRLERKIRKIMGVAFGDLACQAHDLKGFLKRGYKIEQIATVKK